jgi:GNAT superfamily N-acetyltransferase
MTEDLVIRTAEDRDAEAIAALTETWGHPLSRDEVRLKIHSFAQTAGHQFLAAEMAGAVVGFAAMNTALSPGRPGRIGSISGMVVAAQYQRQGIGRRLVDSAEDWLRAQGASYVRVTTASHRAQTAHRFYRALGYRQTGVRFDKDLQP